MAPTRQRALLALILAGALVLLAFPAALIFIFAAPLPSATLTDGTRVTILNTTWGTTHRYLVLIQVRS